MSPWRTTIAPALLAIAGCTGAATVVIEALTKLLEALEGTRKALEELVDDQPPPPPSDAS